MPNIIYPTQQRLTRVPLRWRLAGPEEALLAGWPAPPLSVGVEFHTVAVNRPKAKFNNRKV